MPPLLKEGEVRVGLGGPFDVNDGAIDGGHQAPRKNGAGLTILLHIFCERDNLHVIIIHEGGEGDSGQKVGFLALLLQHWGCPTPCYVLVAVGAAPATNGTTGQPNGAEPRPDGTVLRPDGAMLGPDGTMLGPIGTEPQPDGTMLEPGSAIACPDASPPAPDSPATPTNGAAPPLLPDGASAQPTSAAPSGGLADAGGGGGSWVHSGTCDAAWANGPDWDGVTVVELSTLAVQMEEDRIYLQRMLVVVAALSSRVVEIAAGLTGQLMLRVRALPAPSMSGLLMGEVGEEAASSLAVQMCPRMDAG
ncbi:hypothetical protein AcW1_003869 [Taiwanofungus camphoratus]|nr:hypothetical protein AcW1_003869 [Antrodia cinnamomea]